MNILCQHEKKHGKGSKNSSAYFDNKMIEEEEMENQIDDGTFDGFGLNLSKIV